MPRIIYPKEKEKLLKSLTPDEIKTIRKDNPFKHERDAKIYELCQRGVSCYLLAEIIGISKSSINRIGIYGSNRQPSPRQKDVDWEIINKAVDDFYKQIKKILNHRRND